MSITSSTPFLSINIAPITASSRSIAWGGILPDSRLIKLPFDIPVEENDLLVSIYRK